MPVIPGMQVTRENKITHMCLRLDGMVRELHGLRLSQAERDDVLKHSRGLMDAAENAHSRYACDLSKDSPAKSSLTRAHCLNQVTDLIPRYTDSADERFLNAAEMWYKIACLLPEDS